MLVGKALARFHLVRSAVNCAIADSSPVFSFFLQFSCMIQLMRHEMDEEPILLELQMMITSIKWSPDGEVLGVVGSDVSTNGKAPSSIVQLFSHTGMHLRTLRVPGTRTRYSEKNHQFAMLSDLMRMQCCCFVAHGGYKK